MNKFVLSKYFVAAAIIFVVAAKGIFRVLDNDDLFLFTYPIVNFLSIVFDISYSLTSDGVFIFKQEMISIDKACSGFNFLTICFLCLSIVKKDSIASLKSFTWQLIFIFVITYLMTIAVNCCRLFLLVKYDNLLRHLPIDYHTCHHFAGGFIYLSFLIIIYISYSFYFTTSLKNI